MDFQVEWFDRLASTNALMKEILSRGTPRRSGWIVAAHEQTAGRGRQDRRWVSPPGRNLCFSLFVQARTEQLVAMPSLTMAAALAVNDLLRSRGILSAPKWPNDVLAGGKKICGILAERADAAGIIVGIGLNVNMSSEEAGAIDQPATSMLIETGRPHDLPTTLEALFQPLEYWLTRWNAGGFSALREAWSEKAGPIGRSMSVHDGDVKKSGRLAGFGDHGELLLETGRGIETIWSGDVI